MGNYTKGTFYVEFSESTKPKKNELELIKKFIEKRHKNSHYNINSLNGDNGSWTIEFDSDRYINCEWQMEQIRDYIISKHKNSLEEISADLFEQADGLYMDYDEIQEFKTK